MKILPLITMLVILPFFHGACKPIKKKDINASSVKTLNDKNLDEVLTHSITPTKGFLSLNKAMRENWMAGLFNHGIVEIDWEIKKFIQTMQTINPDAPKNQLQPWASQRVSFLENDVKGWVSGFFRKMNSVLCSMIDDGESIPDLNCTSSAQDIETMGGKITGALKKMFGGLTAPALLANLGNALVDLQAQQMIDNAILASANAAKNSQRADSSYNFEANASGVLVAMLRDIEGFFDQLTNFSDEEKNRIIEKNSDGSIKAINLSEAVEYFSNISLLGGGNKRQQALQFLALIITHVQNQTIFSIDVINNEFKYIVNECQKGESSCIAVLNLIKGHIRHYCSENSQSRYREIINIIEQARPTQSSSWSPYFFTKDEWNGGLASRNAAGLRDQGNFEVNKEQPGVVLAEGETYVLAQVNKELVGGFGFTKAQCSSFFEQEYTRSTAATQRATASTEPMFTPPNQESVTTSSPDTDKTTVDSPTDCEGKTFFYKSGTSDIRVCIVDRPTSAFMPSTSYCRLSQDQINVGSKKFKHVYESTADGCRIATIGFECVRDEMYDPFLKVTGIFKPQSQTVSLTQIDNPFRVYFATTKGTDGEITNCTGN